MVEHIQTVTSTDNVEHTYITIPTILARLIYFVYGVVSAFIVIRIILMLLAANQGNSFVNIIYTISAFLVAPFYGMFNYTPSYGVSVFDISSLIAILVYGLIAWALIYLVTLGSRTGHSI